MPMHQRITAERRHQVWGDLCQVSESLYELADEIHELTLKWWDLDQELVDAHYERCRLQGDEPPATTPPAGADDVSEI